MYALIGAATGAIEGVAGVAFQEAKARRREVGSALQSVQADLQIAAEEKAVLMLHEVYRASGALAGTIAGSKCAFLCVWWWLSEDEIKMKLLQASPVKYRLKDLDFRSIGARYASTPSAAASESGSAASRDQHAVNNALGSDTPSYLPDRSTAVTADASTSIPHSPLGSDHNGRESESSTADFHAEEEENEFVMEGSPRLLAPAPAMA